MDQERQGSRDPLTDEIQEGARLGYSNVSVYEGGKADWIDSGLPFEGSAARHVA